jgi:DNA-binding NtrC family response regulator
VEDDAASLDATVELLMLIGMNPRRADSAAAALAALRAEDFDVLFTDVIMPDMSGTELARRAFAIRPALRIVFASGNPVPAHERFEFEWSALRKPFTLDQLRAAVLPAVRPPAQPGAGGGQPESTDGGR